MTCAASLRDDLADALSRARTCLVPLRSADATLRGDDTTASRLRAWLDRLLNWELATP